MDIIDLKMFSTCFLDQVEHVTYPQHHMICHRSVSNAVWNQFTKIVKSSFFTSNLEVLKSWGFSTSKFFVKKELFTVFVNWFQTALETLLWHIMWCCGYVTCSPWSREHVENIFRSITCIKTFFGRKTWKMVVFVIWYSLQRKFVGTRNVIKSADFYDFLIFSKL